MGYNTSYSLKVVHGEVTEDQLAELIEGDGDAKDALEPDGSSRDWESRWYSHEETMQWLSAEYPDAIFCLSGVGEESLDVWDKYFHNGSLIRTERAKEPEAVSIEDLLTDIEHAASEEADQAARIAQTGRR